MRAQFDIHVSELAAAAMFMSTDESRFALNGVQVELNPSRCLMPLLVATDGRHLLAFAAATEMTTDLPEGGVTFTISRLAVEAICDYGNGKVRFEYVQEDGQVVVKVFLSGHLGVLELTMDAGLVGDRLGQNKFPNWRQVVPTGPVCSVPHMLVNARFLADFHNAFEKMRSHSTAGVTVSFRGISEVIEVRVNGAPDFVGLVMPVRLDRDEKLSEPLPAWALAMAETKPETPKVS